ncbi:MAG: hypothetical protein K2Y18_00185 [Alphaproteobacteria bacterium]|nr:hypothetical protein [Alphaproteobacteria bacterium]
MLKLIVNNTHPIYGSVLSKDLEAKQTPTLSPPLNTFLVDIREFSQNLYIFRAQDFTQDLTCEMTLELSEGFAVSPKDGEEEEYLVPIMTCNFPSINESQFNEKVYWDEYLQGILMVQFQLKILEQLFLFCEEKEAVTLTLTFDETKIDYLEIYRGFFTSEEEIITTRGVQTQIVIPTDVETYDEVIDFMDDVDRDLRQTLWRGQKSNPAFRKYLLDHSLSAH